MAKKTQKANTKAEAPKRVTIKIPRTPEKPAPMGEEERKWWKDFQEFYGLDVDGKVGKQTTAQVSIVYSALGNAASTINEFHWNEKRLKKIINRLMILCVAAAIVVTAFVAISVFK